MRALCNLFVSENSRMLIVNKKKELIEIIKNLMVNQGKNDKLIFEGSVMLYFNIVLNDFEVSQNYNILNLVCYRFLKMIQKKP